MVYLNKNMSYSKLMFPDQTPKLKVSNGLRPGQHKVTICWKYESMDELFDVICLAKHLKSQNCIVSLYLPYIPNARMDRVNSSEEVFTLKHFCDVINSLEFEEVRVVDPHSNVSSALLNNVKVISNNSLIRFAMEYIGRPAYFFPDAGAAKRYNAFQLGKVAGYANKLRDWETGRIQGLEICGNVPNDKPILIVDDICSYGGTFYHTAKKLKEAGAGKIYLCVTHCENSILDGELLKEEDLVEQVFTTNSIFSKTHPKIMVQKII